MALQTNDLRLLLLRRAEELLADMSGGSEFTDIEALLPRLSLRLTRATGGSKTGKAHGALVRTANGFDVLLHGHGTFDLSPRERFTVAHEVGHFVLESELGLRPADEIEYWKIEQMCNEFAATLLLPNFRLSSIIESPPRTSGELLGRTTQIARRNQVSLEVAARRVVEMIRSASIAAVDLEQRDDKLAGIIRWCAESVPWIAAGRGKHIPHEHPIARLLDLHVQPNAARSRADLIDGVHVASQRSGSVVQVAALIFSLEPDASVAPCNENQLSLPL